MIPKFKLFMKPILELLNAKDGVLSRKALVTQISDYFQLSLEDRMATTSSGTNVVYDRVSWATVYLTKAGMIIRPRKGYIQITDEGKALLAENYEIINNKVLGTHSEAFAKYQYIPKYGIEDKRFKNNHK